MSPAKTTQFRETAGEGSPRSLLSQARTGVIWTALSSGVTTALQFLRVAVLARLLGPADFGVVSMVLVIGGFAQVFTHAGLGEAVIQRREPTRSQLSSIYWINVGAGSLLFLAMWLATPLMVAVYREPRISGIVFWVALSFPIMALGQQFAVLLRKELLFKRLSLAEIASEVAGAAVAISSAINGHGILALVWGLLATISCRTLLLAAMHWRIWRPQLSFRSGDLRGYLGFGLYRAGAMTANQLGFKIGHFLIGVLLGAHALGYYYLAYRLALQPLARITPILTKVAFPVFAKIHDDLERLRRGYLLQIRLLAIVTTPLLFGLTAVAPVAIPALLGPGWQPAVPLVQILALVGFLRCVNNPTGALILARGRADWSFFWNLGLLGTQLPGLAVGAYFAGAVGVAIAWLVLQAIYLIAAYYFLVRKLIHITLTEYVTSFGFATIAAGVMLVLITLAISTFTPRARFIPLVGLIGLGATAYFAVLFLFFRVQIGEIIDLLLNRRRVKQLPAT